jgi:phosphatidylethanolamine-binding protein (PEBP) family uncharacterized protein
LDIDTTGYSGPNGEFIHWWVKDIDPNQLSIPLGGSWIGNPTILPTDYGSGDDANGWNGPCPPSGPAHTYTIQITATLLNGNTITNSNNSTFTAGCIYPFC